MKIKWYTLSIACYLISHNLNALDNQQPVGLSEFKTINNVTKDELLLAPISFTTQGLEYFMRDVFNNPYYSQEILPHNFRHLLQFLYHGRESSSRAYAKSVLKLFGNKLKGTEYINAYAFTTMLPHFESLLKPYVTPDAMTLFDQMQKTLNNFLYNSFLSQFDVLKQNPDLFFDQVSQSFVEQLRAQCDQHDEVMLIHVQQAAYRFLDTCISKLIWSSQDHKTIWPSMRSIASHLEQCAQSDILSDLDAIDDLYWSLTYRFTYFLTLAADDLPVCFYEAIKQDLASNPLLLCTMEEQEASLKTKEEHLMQALLTGEAKARMRVQV